MVSKLNTRMCCTRVKTGSAVNVATEPANANCAILPIVPSVTNIAPSHIVVFVTVAMPLVAVAATRVVEWQRWVTHALRLSHNATFR